MIDVHAIFPTNTESLLRLKKDNTQSPLRLKTTIYNISYVQTFKQRQNFLTFKKTESPFCLNNKDAKSLLRLKKMTPNLSKNWTKTNRPTKNSHYLSSFLVGKNDNSNDFVCLKTEDFSPRVDLSKMRLQDKIMSETRQQKHLLRAALNMYY